MAIGRCGSAANMPAFLGDSTANAGSCGMPASRSRGEDVADAVVNLLKKRVASRQSCSNATFAIIAFTGRFCQNQSGKASKLAPAMCSSSGNEWIGAQRLCTSSSEGG